MGTRGLAIAMLAAIGIWLPSCKEDEPPVPPKLSFAEKELTVKESDGEIEIELVLDKPASQTIEVKYSLGGSAVEKVQAGNNQAYDYEITSDYLETEIEAGETTGIIKLNLLSDFGFEEDEVIEITIEEVDDEGIEITRDDEINITLQQEDGLIVVLAWGVQSGENYRDVDMDLFLWAEDESSNLGLTNFGALSGSTQSPEFFFLPTAPLQDGNYGLSCTYYSGSVEPMNFQVSYIKWINGSDETPITKKGTYTLANLNEWDTENGTEPVLAFTFRKVGNDFTDFSDFLGAQASGSRTRSFRMPAGLKKK